MAQDDLKMAQDDLKMAKGGLKMTSDDAKMAQERAKMAIWRPLGELSWGFFESLGAIFAEKPEV